MTNPIVRLALKPNTTGRFAALWKSSPPNLRLAVQAGNNGCGSLSGLRGVERIPREVAPAILVAYPWLDGFLRRQAEYIYRDWALDSGAFSAHNSGMKIDLQEYTDVAGRLLEEDETLTEVFALDVIGDHEATLKNTEEMWRQGVPAIPCYHQGEPEEFLHHIAENYPKIALGGVARKSGSFKVRWAGQCFARVWPKPIHGFGFGSEKAIMAFPWHSVDALSWEIGPCGFGNWRAYGNASLRIRGSNQNLRTEIEWYLKVEKRARDRWAHEMERLKEGTPA